VKVFKWPDITGQKRLYEASQYNFMVQGTGD
jgi:hypothetical protein